MKRNKQHFPFAIKLYLQPGKHANRTSQCVHERVNVRKGREGKWRRETVGTYLRELSQAYRGRFPSGWVMSHTTSQNAYSIQIRTVPCVVSIATRPDKRPRYPDFLDFCINNNRIQLNLLSARLILFFETSNFST